MTALFNASVVFHLGNGERILFWKEPWHHGVSFQHTFPELFGHCTRKNLTVAQAIGDGRWIRHLKRNLSAQATREFTALWTAINNTVLRDESDRVSWKWTADGEFSSKSAYLIQFQGCIRAGFGNFIWKSDAPGKCKIFAWLAMLGRCNTADCLRKRGGHMMRLAPSATGQWKMCYTYWQHAPSRYKFSTRFCAIATYD